MFVLFLIFISNCKKNEKDALIKKKSLNMEEGGRPIVAWESGENSCAVLYLYTWHWMFYGLRDCARPHHALFSLLCI